jgi:hypothetical protein
MEPTPRDEMDTLLDALLPFAQQMIEKHGEFYPYAAALDTSGEIQMVAGYAGEEHPDSSDLIELLYEGLTQQSSAGEIRAAGVCADVRVTPPNSRDMTDAIRVSIEHASSDPIDVFMPYVRRKRRSPQYGELFAQAGTARLFSR